MEIRAVSGNIAQMETGALVVNLFEGMKEPGGATGAVDQALGGYIHRLIADGEATGRKGEITLVHAMGKLPTERVVIVGLGKQEKLDGDVVRGVAAEVARFLRRKRIARAATVVHGAGMGGLGAEEAAQALVEGTLLGLYRFRKHMTKRDDEEDGARPVEILLVEQYPIRLPALEKAVATGRVLAEATALARDLVNGPGNYMTPTALARTAQEVAQRHGLEYQVLEREQMRELGMGALLGVAAGSHEPPKFIILEYRGDPSNSGKTVGLLGKGITFDSGGISLKQAEGMKAMKGDMAGGAAVIAAMAAIAQIKPKINVTGLVPATENLPGGGATKPGDVLVAMSGKTIEVENTDAEGRLILADALCYARQRGLSPLIDVATLTGACRVALGTVCSGIFGNDQELVDRVIAAGKSAGERFWQLPLFDEYKEQNKSDTADVKNSGGQPAGAITAAQFLHEFAEDTPWAHLDIAGTSMTDRESGWQVKGSTGVPVRTFVNLVLEMARA